MLVYVRLDGPDKLATAAWTRVRCMHRVAFSERVIDEVSLDTVLHMPQH